MPSTSIQLQWSLDSTVDNALKIALKFVQIATADNVQPFALLACEKFGSTLPICQATRTKVEQEALTKREPMTLSFARSVIKQGGGDAFAQLSSNVAGLNFLAVASALVSTSSSEEAATTIQRMIDRTAVQKETVPAEYHILMILEVLQPRLIRMGFLERCYQWNWWLAQHESTRSLTSNHYPSNSGVDQLVSALRSLYRIGLDEADTVVITAHSCTSWMLAFIEWCTGSPPNICDAGGGIILPQPESSITLIVPRSAAQDTRTKIELFTNSRSLLDTFLVDSSQTVDHKIQEYHGMVSVLCHGQQTFQDHQVDTSLAQRALLEAIPYALRQVQLLLRYRGHRSEVEGSGIELTEDGSEQLHLLANLFPSERLIDSLHSYIGASANKITSLKDLAPGAVVADLPILQTWAQQSEAACKRCALARRGYEEHSQSSGNHLRKHILGRLGHITANILALSLISTNLDDLRFHFDKFFKVELLLVSDPSELLESMDKILNFGAPTLVDSNEIILHLQRLLGHGNRHTWQDTYWVASSSSGQVLFPQVFQTMRLERQPCLTMVVVPGVLGHADKVPGPRYRAIVSRDPDGHNEIGHTTVPADQVSSPSHFNSLNYEWRTRTDKDLLITVLSTSTASKQLISINPYQILAAIPKLVFANSCPHDQRQRLDDVQPDYEFVHPSDFFSVQPHYVEDNQRPILIFASSGNDALRMMIVGALHEWRFQLGAVVLGQRACFGCSLNLCRLIGSRTLVC